MVQSSQSPKKILHVIPFVSAQFGGPSRAIFELCASQNRSGAIAEIATTCAKSETDYGLCAGQTKVIGGVVTRFFKGSIGTYRYSPRLARWLGGHARDYDILHVHSVFTHPTLAAGRIAKKQGIPYIIRTQGILYPWCLDSISKYKKRAYLALFEMNNLKGADRIHFTTEHERSGCAYPDLKKRSYVLPLGLDPIQGQAGREIVDTVFSQLRGKRILLCLSRLHPIKGFEIFLPAVAQILKDRSEWVFVIGGRGETAYEESLKALVRQHDLLRSVFFVGEVAGQTKQALLQNAEGFVLASHSENFGMAILEAMQQGIPVVISNRIGLQDEVQKHEAGLVFSHDVESITDTLSRILDDAPLRARLGNNGRALVESQHSWEHISKAQINIYDQILHEEKQP